jgi:DNA ligase-associated metallophosphoesterase
MQGQLTFFWGGNNWILDASGACYLPDYKLLIISDFHIGKVQHFRKHGIAVPVAAARANISKLEWVIARYQPEKLVFLGDLFHSDVNSEIHLLQQLRAVYPKLDMRLVPGNHDLHSLPVQAGLFTLTPLQYEFGGMVLQHLPPEAEVNVPTVHGHWHPAFSLYGKGRQKMRLACFAFSRNTAVLPAFGLFTGKADLPEDPRWEHIMVLSKEGIASVPPSLLR